MNCFHLRIFDTADNNKGRTSFFADCVVNCFHLRIFDTADNNKIRIIVSKSKL